MKTLFYSALLLFTSLSLGQNETLLLETNFKGEVVSGSVENLIAQVETGKDIKISWSLDFNADQQPEVTHWVDGSFITVIGGHVFNQVEAIYAQSPNLEIPQILLGNSPLKWVAVIGSNGKLISRFVHPDVNGIEDENYRKTMEELSKPTEEYVATRWVLKN